MSPSEVTHDATKPAVTFTRTRMLAFDVISGEFSDPLTTGPLPPPHRAIVIVLVHQHPIGAVRVLTHYDDANGTDYNNEIFRVRVREAAWHEYHSQICTHLVCDGIPVPNEPSGLSALSDHLCTKPFIAHPTSPPLVTVTIASIGDVESCVKTVRHILESDYANFEIVIVDNTDEGQVFNEPVAQFFPDDPRIRVVHEPKKGLSFARNRGLAEARGAIVVFTDDDVIVTRCWISAIVTMFASDKNIACVTGSIITSEIETPAQAWLEQYGGYHKGFSVKIYDLDEHSCDEPLYPYDSGRFGSGANIAFRSNVLRELGGFAIDLGAGTPAHGGEDIDVLRRTITAGYRLAYEPGALIWHQHRRSYASLRTQMYRYGVGLSATITRWMLTDSRARRYIMRRIPSGIRHLFSPSSAKNMNKDGLFPRQLTLLEYLGILLGPMLYVKSRRVVRMRDRQQDRTTL